MSNNETPNTQSDLEVNPNLPRCNLIYSAQGGEEYEFFIDGRRLVLGYASGGKKHAGGYWLRVGDDILKNYVRFNPGNENEPGNFLGDISFIRKNLSRIREATEDLSSKVRGGLGVLLERVEEDRIIEGP